MAMRVYASKNLGHGVRVGVGTNLSARRPAPPPPLLGPALAPVQLHAPVYVMQRNRALKQWAIATAVVYVLTFAGLYPLALLALPMALILSAALLAPWKARNRAKRLTMASYQRRLSSAEYRHLVKAAKLSGDMHVREVA
ncbi:MAG: hypothetical protein JWO67_3190 [Streptosporangiaceae bacterium]|nr:hypothetical protein [Streptosporangiaceae bacterium]